METQEENHITQNAWKCQVCDAISEDADPSPLYECQNDGTIFNRDNSADGMSHRCPDCNKFAGKVGDESCLECGEGPVDEIQAYQNEEGEWVEVEETPSVATSTVGHKTAKQLEYMADLADHLFFKFVPPWLFAPTQGWNGEPPPPRLPRERTERIELWKAYAVKDDFDPVVFIFKSTTSDHCVVVVRREPTPPKFQFNALGEFDQVQFADSLAFAQGYADTAWDEKMKARERAEEERELAERKQQAAARKAKREKKGKK